MSENELETTRVTTNKTNVKRIAELENWFRFEYPDRLNRINRYNYLGLKPPESRYSLEKEAYEKENELRVLKGLEPLPKLNFIDLF